jgi:hypothetical protein
MKLPRSQVFGSICFKDFLIWPSPHLRTMAIMLPMYFSKGSNAELTGLLRVMRNMCQIFDDSFYHGRDGMVKETQAAG